MALFGRKKKAANTEAEPAVGGSDATALENSTSVTEAASAETQGAPQNPDTPGAEDAREASETPETEKREAVLGEHTADELGPFDSRDVPRPEGFLDFGSLWLPNVPGVMFMMEADPQTQEVTGLRVQIAASVLQLQVFAAPKSRNLWFDIREEIAEGLTKGGGRSEERTGPYGDELFASVPVQAPGGGVAYTMMRFLGVDGPRWFLRGVLSGPAATDEQLAAPFIDLLRVVVVHRGNEPRPPRELLPMHMPRDIEQAPAPDTFEDTVAAELNPFERGPEITEVR